MAELNSLNKLVLAAVSEQVNTPIDICIERGIFKKYGVEVEFRVVPEGTGKMLDMIEQGAADIAITVADAFITGKGKGRPIQMCGTWVNSPLVWTVAGSGPDSGRDQFKTFVELKDSKQGNSENIKIGVSRLGSGSHTMAHYLAQLNDVPKASLDFKILNDFTQLRDGVNRGTADVFLWEKFTTKPFFDSKELQYLGEVPTPWPAFVFISKASADAVSENSREASADEAGKAPLSAHQEMLIRNKLFPALYEGVEIFLREAEDGAVVASGAVPATIQRIVSEFGHTEADARLWISKCRYAADRHMKVDVAQLVRSVDTLRTVGLVPAAFTAQDLWTSTATGQVNPVITTSEVL